MIAFNLMSLFKQVVVKDKIRATLKTLRYSTFGIGSYIVKKGSQRILKMALNMRRRSWITRLWEQAGNIKPPFISIKT